MAPKTTGVTVTFDHRSQVIENCEFFTAKDDYVTVVTAKEPSGQFKAIAVHTSGQERDALMASEPCDSVLEAMASLHLKTTEAVQLYIVTNGYSHPPRDLDKDDETALDDEDDDDDDDDDATSVASDTTTASSAAASLWSNSDTEVVVTPPSSTAHRHGRSAVPAAARKPAGATHRKGRKARGSRASKAAPAGRQPDSDDERRPPRVRIIHPPHRVLPGARPVPPGWKGGPPPQPPPPPPGAFRGGRPGSAFGYTMPQPPPPPPPGFSVPPPPGPPSAFGPVPPMPSMGPGNSHAAPPAMLAGGPPLIMGGGAGGTRAPAGLAGPGAAVPGPATTSSTSSFPSSSSSPSPAVPGGPAAAARTHDVRLTITWLHHSSARVVEAVRPSLRALQETALAYVRQHPQAFEHVTAHDTAPGRAWALRACVRRAWFADDGPDAAPWDLGAYRGGDDLSRLFAALEGGTGTGTRAGGGAMPRLEVEVDYIRGPAPGGVMPA